VQLELLPENDPDLAGFDISGYVFPTEEVSGDYYDWVEVFEDQIGITVADAVGKGIPAALLMAFCGRRSGLVFRRDTPRTSSSQDKQSVMGFDRGQSVRHGDLRTSRHDQPHLRFRERRTQSAASHQTRWRVSIRRVWRYSARDVLRRSIHQHFIRFEKGQVLVIYTDGITEAANANDEEFGQERFAKSVLAGIDLPAKKLIDHIRKDVADFTERKFLDDDGTLFIVKAL
jgi:sigma-B regulation protein RsbU (phosphoserine phosphatase)